MTAPARVFISYSQKDEVHRDELLNHLSALKRQGLVEAWHDRCITAGDERQQRIREHIQWADLVLLLVSPDFMASDYLHDAELRWAMERHQQELSRIVPILVRPADLQGAVFAELACLPGDARPVTTWPDRDQAWLDVASGIRRLVEPSPSSGAPSAASPAAPDRAPSSSSLRKVLMSLLVLDEDLDAFALDHFPSVHQRFSAGMDRTRKLNLLLQLSDRRAILAALRREHPGLAGHEALLRYE